MFTEYILWRTHGIYDGRWVTNLFRQNVTFSSNLHYYVQEKIQLSLLSMNKWKYVFTYLISTNYIIILHIYLCEVFICLLGLDSHLIGMRSPCIYSRLAKVYCTCIYERISVHGHITVATPSSQNLARCGLRFQCAELVFVINGGAMMVWFPSFLQILPLIALL
jgi:hypothetical protein